MAEKLFDRERFIADARARGVTLTDEQIDSFIARKQQNQPQYNYSTQDQPRQRISDRDLYTLPTGMDQASKGEGYGVIANTLWAALDTALFGLPTILTPEEYEIRPTTVGEKVGAGLGGFAGMLVPFGLAKAGVQAGVRGLSKYGTKQASNNIVAKGSEYLAKSSPSRFGRLNQVEREQIFNPVTKPLTDMHKYFKEGVTKDEFLKQLDNNIDMGIKESLGQAGLKNMGKRPLADLKQIIRNEMTDASGNLPIHTLEQRLQIAFNSYGFGNIAGGRLANGLAKTVEEGIFFAAAETPFEVLKTMDSEQEADIIGTMGHAFVIGNLLGTARFIPGGKDQGNVMPAIRRIMGMSKERKGYLQYDINTEEGRRALGYTADMLMKKGAGELLENTSGLRGYISSSESIKRILQNPDEARKLQKGLSRIDDAWNKDWWKLWAKEAAQDYTGSFGRMAVGSMVMSTSPNVGHGIMPGGMYFDDMIPLEDKIMNAALGAIISKKGVRLKYKNAEGKTQEWQPLDIESKYTYDSKFQDLDSFLKFLGAPNQNEIFLQRLKTEIAEQKFLDAERTPDIDKIMNILKDRNFIVKADSRKRSPKKPAVSEEHPIYTQLHGYVNNNLLNTLMPGYRMLQPGEVSSKRAKNLEKALFEENFSSTIGGKGIGNPLDMIDIMYDANSKSWQSVIDLHKKYAVEIYNKITPEGSAVDVKDPFFIDVKDGVLGATLTAEQKSGLTKFRRVAEMLHKHGYARRNRNRDLTHEKPTKEQVDDALLLIKEAEKELNKVWYGEEIPTGTQVIEFGQDRVLKFIEGQGYWHGLKRAHDMLYDFNNRNGAWGDAKEGFQVHDGQRTGELINKLFLNNEGFLHKEIEISGKADPQLKQFVENMRDLLIDHPDTRDIWFDGMGERKVVNPKDVRDLRRLLEDNNLTGLSYADANFTSNFVIDLKSLAQERKLLGATRTDTKLPINSKDRSNLQYLMENGIVNKNLEVVQEVSVIKDMIATISEAAPGADPKRFGKFFGKQGATEQLKALHNIDSTMDIFQIISEAANSKQMKPEQLLNEVVQKFDSYVKPYVFDGKNGVLKPATTMKAEMDAHTLMSLVSDLNKLDVIDRRVSHDSLIDTLSEIKDSNRWDVEQSRFLNSLYQTYYSKSSDPHKALHLLKKYKLYNEENNAFDLSSDDALANMRKVMSIMDFEMKPAITSAQLSQRVLEYTKKYNTELDKYQAVTLNDFNKRYFVEFEPKERDGSIWDKDNVSDIASDLLNKARFARKDEMVDIFHESVSNAERVRFATDLVSVLRTHKGNRNLNRYHAVKDAGVMFDDSKPVTDNSLFRMLDGILGKNNYGVVDLNLITSEGILNGRRESSVEKFIASELFGTEKAVDKSLKISTQGNWVDFKDVGSQYLTMHGDLSWGLAIPANARNKIAESFYDFVESNRAQRQGYGEVFADFDKIINRKIKVEERVETDAAGKETVVRDISFKDSTPHQDGMAIEIMVNSMWLEGNMKKLFWDHAKETSSGKDPHAVTKMARRLRMMSNISGTELSVDMADISSRVLKEAGLGKIDASEGISKLKKEGFKFVIAADEKFDTSPWASIINSSKEQLKLELEANPKLKNRQDNLDEMGGDVSHVDSYMVVNPFNKKFQGLAFMSGGGHLNDIGALKYHLHRLGGEADAFLGKTGLFLDERLNGFFRENPGVDGLIFDSGSKLKSDRLNVNVENNLVLTDFNSLDALNKVKLEVNDAKIQDLRLEDMTHMSIKAGIKDAVMPYQVTNWLSRNANREIYETWIDPKVREFQDGANSAFNNADPIDALAYAKYLKSDPTSNTGVAFYDRLIDAGMYPYSEMLLPTYKNQVKRTLIDNNGVMSMQNKYGGQSVLSPDMPGLDKMRNSTFELNSDGTRTQYTIGQIMLPASAKNRQVLRDRLSIVEHSDVAADRTISWNEFVKKAAVEKSDMIGSKANLGDVFDLMAKYSAKAPEQVTYEVLINAHRTPSTRPGDVLTVGLKGFVDIGNQVRLNSFDGRYRSELDFDTDVMSYWWDTPSSAVKEWHSHAGRIKNANIHTTVEKTSLGQGQKSAYNWFDIDQPGSMRQYNRDQALSEFMRGQAVKMQRITEHLKESSFEVKIPGRGRFTFNEEKLNDKAQELTDDIQNILDATTGFNINRYKPETWSDNFLFGVEGKTEGLFKREKWEDGKWVSAEGYISNALERDILRRMIQPYSNLLRLGSGIWDTGQRKSVKYDDILEQIRTYDDSMRNLNKRTYFALKRKGYDDVVLKQIFANKTYKDNITDWNNIYGNFGSNNRVMLAENFQNLLPFERAMATIASKDMFKVDMPSRMFGEKLSLFEKGFNEYLQLGDTNKALELIIKDARNDSRALGFVNFLDWRIGEKKKLRSHHLNDGNKVYAENITKSLNELQTLKKAAEEKFSTNREIANMMNEQAVYRYTGEIIQTLRTPRGMEGPARFSSLKDALDWTKNNKAKIRKFARSKPYKFVGIKNNEYFETMILNEVLGKFRDINIDPTAYRGYNKELAQDLYNFKKDYRGNWKKVITKDTNRDPMVDETNLNRLMEQRLGQLFDKWEAKQPGLGRLMLWKVMAPEPTPGVVTYFNGTLSEGFSRTSLGLSKLGMRFIFNAPEHRFSEFQKTELADMLSRQYNGFYDAYHGRKISKASFEQSWLESTAQMRDQLFQMPEPLLDTQGWDTRSPKIQEAGINEQVRNVFGYEREYSVGYLMAHEMHNPRAIGEVMKASSHSTMPAGYIPFDYSGMHPRITGWQTFNNAKYNDAKIFLGDALSKNVLHLESVRPVFKKPFADQQSRRETDTDLLDIIDTKDSKFCGR